jgi:hypothetical protein
MLFAFLNFTGLLFELLSQIFQPTAAAAAAAFYP